MATGGEALVGPSSSFDELLICPVCLDSFKDPKTLTCLHSFCSGCLESCRRPYRRDLTCPVCKKITHLPPSGIPGLQHDFRIQQIRDILQKQNTSPPPNAPMQLEEDETKDSKFCDLCKSQQKQLQASHHCTHCCMYFCKQCVEKHNVQTLFSTHHVVDMSNNDATDILFCKTHKDQPLRYFCKVCNSMLCTICTLDHESDHSPVPLDKGVIDKYHQELQESLTVLSTKLSEVKSRSKYVETMKQTYRKALYEAQRSIRDKTNEIISAIRDKEKQLLQEVQRKTEEKMKALGLDVLGEMNFHRTNIESLHAEVHSVIQGSPQHCLTIYEDLIGRMKSVADAPLPSMQKTQTDNVIKFVPTNDDFLSAAIGQLKECTISEEDRCVGDDQPASPNAVSYNSVRTGRSKSKRTNSILNALSPNRKSDVKVGKVKAFFAERPPRASSPNAINADDLLVSSDPSVPSTSGGVASGSQQEEAKATSYGSHLDTPPASPVDDAQCQLLQKPRLLFKVDQVGGWPGKIMSPVAAAFQPDGSVVVAESENRLQLFDQAGQSQRVIGWGKIKPQGLAIAPNGRLCITDRKDKCIKMFSPEGEMVATWGTGMFSNPCGIATSQAGKFVITDTDKHMVSIHGSDGSLLTQFGSWGSGDYQFNSPSYTTIGPKEQIVISDSCNNCVKMYDTGGKFLSKTGIIGNTQLRRPQGMCFDHHGNLAVADRDNHRICLFSQELKYICTLLGKHDGIKYPCDVNIGTNGQVIVVESHSGFLTKDPHHTIKMYQIYS